MRAVGVHEDVVVVTSRVWQTTCTLVRSGEEAFAIDSPVYPDELELLPAVAEQARFAVKGRLATHADWDHLLGGYAFPNASLGCAETTAARLTAEPGAAQRELREFDQRHYVERLRPLSISAAQALPVPGYCSVGERELELHSAEGHTADGMAVWVPWAEVLVCGDYLSPVEIPTISSGGSLDGYAATLERLGPLVERAQAVVPGHGAALSREEALDVLAQDRDYLEALRGDGPAAPLPEGRSGTAQRAIHAANAAVVGGAG